MAPPSELVAVARSRAGVWWLRMLSSSEPSERSATWHSLTPPTIAPPSVQVAPWSALQITWEPPFFVSASTKSHGITSRPFFVWIPMPGPVAYQVHSGFFTSLVISTGLLQVTPSSVLFTTHTVRVPFAVRSMIFDSDPRRDCA